MIRDNDGHNKHMYIKLYHLIMWSREDTTDILTMALSTLVVSVCIICMNLLWNPLENALSIMKMS